MQCNKSFADSSSIKTSCMLQFFFGFVLLAVALAVGLVAFLVIQLRFWWLRRKFGVDANAPPRPPSQPGEDSNLIDAEYEVVSREEDD